MCAILLSAAREMCCSTRASVKVIRRRVHECTIENYTYIQIYLLYDCMSQLNLIGQLEGNISPYCPLVIARAYSDMEVIQ